VVSVLEIAGGRSAEAGITPGDLVRHPLFGTAQVESPAEDAPAEAAPGEAPEADGQPAEPPADGG
jgi:hypothetical protein